MSGLAPHPFWNFSLEVYAGEGVAQACIALQDRRHADANFLLFCCWLGASGRGAIAPARLRALIGQIDPWQRQIVQPLRLVRRTLAAGEGLPDMPHAERRALRRRMADAEIEAEHAEQLMLAEEWAMPGNRDRPVKERLAQALANLSAYAEAIAVRADREDRQHVATILRAAFPTLHAEEIAHALNLDRA